MRIGEVARRSGLSTATIRFYERRGVLPGPSRADNGYREYSGPDADRAATFARFRDLGIDAVEAGRLADQCASGQCDATWAELPPLLAAHRQSIAARIAELRELDARLATLQSVMTTTGQSDPSSPSIGKEIDVVTCDCDGTCCGPHGPLR